MKYLLLITLAVVAAMGNKSAVLKEFTDGNSQFTSEVYKILSKLNPGNFLVCPLSAQIILALTHFGARGNTAKELAAGISLPDDQDKIQKMIVELSPYLQVHDKYILTSANKVYLAKGYKLVEQFIKTSAEIFGAESQNVDFALSKEAAQTINKWVAEKTYDTIKHLIDEDLLDDNTVTVLVNAMYFKANWLHQFDPRATNEAEFHVNDTYKLNVDMMLTRADLKYYESDDLKAQFVELPYEGEDTTMTLVLPTAKDGLAELEARIFEVLVAPKYQTNDVQISLPRFKMGTEIDFKTVLQELGVHDAFAVKKANFSGLSEVPAYISAVVQKTIIEVSEKGTTAAASTAVVVSSRTGPQYQFYADHPFIYILKHKVSGVFFIGRFLTPENTALKIE